jgi:RNA-directed DNA polymerase
MEHGLSTGSGPSDPHSYGFRPYCGCWDANAQISNLLDKPNSPTWILDATIEKCFDSINHHWLLKCSIE